VTAVAPVVIDAPILALCTATRTASIALLFGDEVRVELQARGERHQAESLLPMVDRGLSQAGIVLGDLAGIALCIGPGSFTSLRIGLATAKGIAFGGSPPVAPVSTLQAIASALESDGSRPIIGMSDARRGEVYAAAFAGEREGWAPRPEVLGERVYTAEEIAERIPADSILVGDGVEVVGERLREILGPELRIASSSEPTALAVARLGAALLAEGRGVDAARLAPRYVRRAEAEVTRTSERFEAP